MTYQTGTVANLSALKTTIETFCTSNGWTKSGNVLHRGTVYWELVYQTATQVNLRLWCGDGIDGSNLLTNSQKVGKMVDKNFNISLGNPFTYHFFMTPDQNNFFCIVNYQTDYIKHLCVGSLVKYGDWTGGEYYSIAEPDENIWAGTGTTQAFDFASQATPVFRLQGNWNPCPFFPNPISTSGRGGGSVLRCNIDGWTFRSNSHYFNTVGNDEEMVSAHLTTYRLIHAAFNPWNQEAILVPYFLHALRGSNDLSIIGKIDQIRVTRNDNYNIGDIVTLGSDQWMIFPFYKRGFTYPIGRSYLQGVSDTGTLAYAVRYQP